MTEPRKRWNSTLPSSRQERRRAVHPVQPPDVPGFVSEAQDSAGEPAETEIRASAEYRALKTVIWARSGGRCEISGEGCRGRAEHPHHVYPTREGGRVVCPPKWLVPACGVCHDWCHHPRTRRAAEEQGWIVPKAIGIE